MKRIKITLTVISGMLLLGSVQAQVSTNLWGPTESRGSPENHVDPYSIQPIPVETAGARTQKVDGWYNLAVTSRNVFNPYSGQEELIPGSAGYPGFPGYEEPWPSSIASQVRIGDSSAAELYKVRDGAGGGPIPFSTSMYYGGFSGAANADGGVLGVRETNPLTDLTTIVFQITIGEAVGYDFYDGIAPMLYINGSSTGIVADFDNKMIEGYSGTFDAPEVGKQPIYTNLYAYEWDVTGFEDGVASFEIQWGGVQHAQIYGLNLTQFGVIPEPGTYALLIGGLVLGVVALRRRRL